MDYFGKRFQVTYVIPNSGGSELLYGQHDDLETAQAEAAEMRRASPSIEVTVRDQEINALGASRIVG